MIGVNPKIPCPILVGNKEAGEFVRVGCDIDPGDVPSEYKAFRDGVTAKLYEMKRKLGQEAEGRNATPPPHGMNTKHADGFIEGLQEQSRKDFENREDFSWDQVFGPGTQYCEVMAAYFDKEYAFAEKFSGDSSIGANEMTLKEQSAPCS